MTNTFITQKLVPVLISLIVIILIAVMQERSRFIAAIVATMPVSAPLAMWIIYKASNNDSGKTEDFVGSMMIGIIINVIFMAACLIAFKQKWEFKNVMFFGYGIWGILVIISKFVFK
jgi:uncharacterized membrane protein (GlpM family)